jgi:hypothetical protein
MASSHWASRTHWRLPGSTDREKGLHKQLSNGG